MAADVLVAQAVVAQSEGTLPLPIPPAQTFSGQRRALIAVCLGTFFASLMFIAPTPFFPQMARDLQVSVSLLGQVMTAMLLLSALLGLVIGPLCDRSGYRPLILFGLMAGAVTLFNVGLAPSFLVLLLASITGGVSDAAVLGPSLALAGTHFEGDAGRRAIGWANGTEALSAIVVVPVLTAIGAIAGWRLAFVAAGAAALVVFAIAWFWLPRQSHRAADPLRLDAILAPYRPLLKNPTMQRLYASRALSAACWFGLLTYLGAFLADVLGMGTAHIGLVYMAGGSAFFLGSLAVGSLFAAVPARQLVVAGYSAMALLMAVAFSARLGTAGTIVLIAAAALAMGLGVVGMIALFLAETPTGAGTTLTLSGSMFNIGAAAGGASGGLLLTLFGYDALAIALPLFGVGAAVLAQFSGRSGAQRGNVGEPIA